MTKSKILLIAGKLFILLILLLVSVPAFAQVDTAWVRRYNGGDSTDEAYAVAVDGSGNVYVTGASDSSGTYYDYATIKYLPNGNTAWVKRYNGPENFYDYASAIAVDGSGNAYVTGFSFGSGCATIKYYPNGDTAWVRIYSGSGNGLDWGNAIAVDASGNVYVTGGSDSSGNNKDYVTIKYKSNGDTAWVRRYNGPGASSDWANAIAVDGSGNVYVTGASDSTGTYLDYATIKYYPNGNTAWVRRYNGPGDSIDIALAIAVESSGNVYVTGASDSTGTYLDYATIKYYPNGNTAWVKRYNGPGNGDDIALALAIDGFGNIYVTGYSDSSSAGTDYEYATIKYYPNGDTGWVRKKYSGPLSPWYAHPVTLIALDDSGNVYVTGAISVYPDSFDYGTIKYDSNGTQLWMKTYNGPGNGYDEAYSIAVDKSGNVYVTGESYGQDSFEDYATIKYVRHCQEESITVVFPNGGETLYVDATYYLTWSWACVESVKIQYSTNGGSSWLPISEVTESDGSYSWLVPNPPSQNCLVKISDAKDGDPVDISDDYFTIICEPKIVVKSPNGRECWRVGTTYDIKWDHFCFHDSVLIEYTTNNGRSWDTIVETTTNDGLYPWTTPDTSSDSCLIRISDIVDHIPSDTSDNLFSIVIWVRGDVNGDGVINAADVVYLINYLYIGGPAPLPWAAGDVNSDGTINAADVVYLINYLYIKGPPPGC